MDYWWLYLLPGALGAAFMVYIIVQAIPGLWKTSDRFNSTASWLPAPLDNQPTPPVLGRKGLSPREFYVQIFTPHLEAHEEVEGFARGFFSPPRPRDWGKRHGVESHPLLIVVTSRRMLLFELRNEQAVYTMCFIPFDAMQHLSLPKSGFLGETLLKFALLSGHEYQFGFLGPILDPECLEQERQLVAYLRVIGPRLPTRVSQAA